MIRRAYTVYILSFVFDARLLWFSFLWIRVSQRNLHHRSLRSVCLHSPIWTVASRPKPGPSLPPPPPQRRLLPHRLWAPMLQESHELATGLNYKVAFLQRGVPLWLFISLPLVSLLLSFPGHWCLRFKKSDLSSLINFQRTDSRWS